MKKTIRLAIFAKMISKIVNWIVGWIASWIVEMVIICFISTQCISEQVPSPDYRDEEFSRTSGGKWEREWVESRDYVGKAQQDGNRDLYRERRKFVVRMEWSETVSTYRAYQEAPIK